MGHLLAMLNPAQTGSRLGASRKPKWARASASQMARLLASPFLLRKLGHPVVARVVAPAKIWRAARCRSVPHVRCPQTLLDTGFQHKNPLCAGWCRDLPNCAKNTRFFMGFKRSRVQIPPARFFPHQRVVDRRSGIQLARAGGCGGCLFFPAASSDVVGWLEVAVWPEVGWC